MYDKCLACGRPIFTVRMPGITLQQRWTHGGYGFVDRQHVPIPTRHEYIRMLDQIEAEAKGDER